MTTVVLVDMDYVVADLDRRFRQVWTARHPGRPVIEDEDRRHHRIVDDHAAELKAVAAAILAEPGFTGGIPPVEDALAALDEMDEHGYRVQICASPLSARSPNAAAKLDWVEDQLGLRWRDRTIVTKDKTMVRGDVLIDDALTVGGTMAPTWRHVVLDRPVNRGAAVTARMTWSTWRVAPA